MAANQPGRLLIIAGPTACGKTRTAIEAAKRIGGEVISADSMQVYRGMDIGTAKPTPAEREGVPHHLIDVVQPDEAFSAARYQILANEAIASVLARGAVPILTGGTGFYINAVAYGNEFAPAADMDTDNHAEDEYRAKLQALAFEQGNAHLHDLLRQADPEAAEAIHPNNVKRVARALSFYYHTGKKISQHNKNQRRNAPVYDTLFIRLHMDRILLYERINRRVKDMFDAGLADEVKRLLAAGYHEGLVSMQGLGYKETVRHLRGEYSLEQAAEAIRTGTRRYAKRQFTWFTHRMPESTRVLTVAPGLEEAAAEQITFLYKEQGHE